MAGPEEKVYFFFLSGAKKGKIESAPATGLIRIGRQPDSTLQLDPYEDIPASGDHAQVVCEGGERFLLEDRGSSWGTFKNDVPVVGRVPITTGDVIMCGQDAQGRQGPRLKFYLEKDVLRCPACEGPVYKRHFKCPVCGKKHCLRCIDFKAKTCKACGPLVITGKKPAAKPTGTGDPGFEILEDDDDDDGAKPARVVVSGRDARSFKRAQAKDKEKKKEPRKATPADPGIVAEHVDLEAPFCAVCCEFADGPIFVCPACRQTVCVKHKKGVVCPPCAGVAAGAPDAVSRASEPELVVPDMDDDEPPPPPKPAPRAEPKRSVEDSGRRRTGASSGAGPTSRLGSGSGADRRAIPSTMRFTGGPPQPDDDLVVLARPDPSRDSAPPALRAEPIGGPPKQAPPSAKQAPPPSAPPRQAAPPSAPPKQAPAARPPSDAGRPGGNVPTPPPGTPDPLLTRSNIDARRPPAIPCERCNAPLSATSFFICGDCRSRLCGQHRSATKPTSCDRCGAPPSPFDTSARAPLPYASTSAPAPQPTPLPPTPGMQPPTRQRPMLGGPGWTGPAPPSTPRRPQQDLIETAGDDVLPPLHPPSAQTPRSGPPPAPLGLSGSGSARNPKAVSVSGSGVRFECPYCDEQLMSNLGTCPKCGREL